MKKLKELFPQKFNDKKDQKIKERLRKYWPIFVEKYADELNNFSFGSAGTALTIYRDGYMDDSDIDMGIMRKDLSKLYEFILKNKLPMGTVYVRDGKLSEIKIKLPETNVDFFIFDINEKGVLESGSVWLKGIRAIPKLIIKNEFYDPKSDTLKTIKKCGINIPSDVRYYEMLYGKNWNVKISGSDYINSKEFSSIKTTQYITENIDKTKNYGVKNNKKKHLLIKSEIKKINK